MRPIIFGEVLFDCFPDGSVVLGGAPFNVAWNLHAVGLNPLLISRVGDDPLGREIRGAMQAHGMECSGLQLDSAHPTGTVEVTLDKGQPSYEIVAERAWDFIDHRQIPPLREPLLLYHGSLAARHAVSAESLRQLRKRAEGAIFLDVNLRDPWWSREQLTALLHGVRWIKLNDAELESLATAQADPAACRAAWGSEQLILTRGEAGAELWSANAPVVRIAPSGRVVVADTVGAGDAFASVLLVGLLRSWSLADTLHRAQAFASQVVTLRGATTTDRAFYRRVVAGWGE